MIKNIFFNNKHHPLPLGISDIDQVIRIFSIIKNIQIHGTIGDNEEYRSRISVQQIYDNMDQPKLTKDVIRDFCEEQASKDNLIKHTRKRDFTVRQAIAEYEMSDKALKLLALFKSDSTITEVIDMISWNQKEARKRKESKKQQTEEENPEDGKN